MDSDPRASAVRSRRLKHGDVRLPRMSQQTGRSAEPVSMPNLQDVDARPLRGCCVPFDLCSAQLMPDGVISVTQGRIADYYPRSHWLRPALACRWYQYSATAMPAQLMMSRLPAYFGRKSPRPCTVTLKVTLFLSMTGANTISYPGTYSLTSASILAMAA